jgi:hypothetical protein
MIPSLSMVSKHPMSFVLDCPSIGGMNFDSIDPTKKIFPKTYERH